MITTVAVVLTVATLTAVHPVPPERQMWYRRHLLPLPHNIAVESEITLDPSEIGIVAVSTPDPIETQARGELVDLFKTRTGVEPAGKAFEIVLRVVERDDRIESLPHADQAYVIEPAGNDKLVVTAIDPKGLYYGVQTLKQLLAPAMPKGKVTVPLVTVIDYPDLGERGVWNWETRALDPFYASMKLNYVNQNVSCKPETFKRDVPVGLKDARSTLAERRKRAFSLSFRTTHVNFLDRYYGLYDAYPELAGKGKRAWQHANPHPKHRVPCASNPLFTKVLTEMLTAAAKQGIPEFSVWLSEFDSQCECDACMKTGQSIAESEAMLTAWRKVQKTYPDFQLRMFYAITPRKDQIDDYFAKLPLDVKLERCGRGIKSAKPRPVYFNRGFDAFAGRGGWVASYDVPIRIEGFTPHQTRDFIRQLHRRKWSGAYGYGPRGMRDDFGVSAVAEWGWNVNGRNEKQFAVAWATLHGYPHPDTFGEWVEVMGPIGWDIASSYGNDRLLRSVPASIRKRPAGKVARAQYPDGLYLGGSTLEYFTTPDSFDEKLAVAEKATDLAKQTGVEEVTVEHRRIIAHINVLKNIYRILDQIYTANLSQDTARKTLADAVAALQSASDTEVDATNTLFALRNLNPPNAETPDQSRIDTRKKLLNAVRTEIDKRTSTP